MKDTVKRWLKVKVEWDLLDGGDGPHTEMFDRAEIEAQAGTNIRFEQDVMRHVYSSMRDGLLIQYPEATRLRLVPPYSIADVNIYLLETEDVPMPRKVDLVTPDGRSIAS